MSNNGVGSYLPSNDTSYFMVLPSNVVAKLDSVDLLKHIKTLVAERDIAIAKCADLELRLLIMTNERDEARALGRIA